MKRVANRYLGYRLGLFTFYAFVGIPNSQCTSDADPPRARYARANPRRAVVRLTLIMRLVYR